MILYSILLYYIILYSAALSAEADLAGGVRSGPGQREAAGPHGGARRGGVLADTMV